MVDSIEQTSGQGNIPPKPPRNQGNFLIRLLRPSKKKVFGLVAIASVGGVIYVGLQLWAKKNLPSLIETKATEILKRPVKLEAIKSISLTNLELTKLSIPATDNDQDSLQVAKIKAKYNLLALIFKGHLPVKVEVVDPQIYLDQAKDGTWLNLDLPEQEKQNQNQELPIDVDLKLDLQKAKIEVKPYQQDSLTAKIDGDARYNSTQDNLVGYDFAAVIEEAEATFVGQTFLDTGKTDTKLLIDSLELPKIFTLLPNSPVDIQDGVLNAELNVEVPSWQKLTSANIEGLVNLQQLSGEVTHADQQVTAKSQLNLKGRKAEIETTEAKIGDLTAQVKGGIDLQTGYDLAIEVLPVQLASLQKTFAPDLPVPIAGEIYSKLDITGAIKEPQLKGELISTEEITLDKEQIKAVNAYFEADLNKIVLENLTVLPAAGGAITANGLWEIDLANSLKQQEVIDLARMPLSLNLQANLPVRAIAEPYVEIPANFKVDNIVAEGNLGGTLTKPKGLLKWQLDPGEIASREIANQETANQSSSANIPPTKITAKGEVVYFQDNLQLRNTNVSVGSGTAEIRGRANLKAKTWQGAIKSEPLALTPLLAPFTVAGLNLDRPITLQNADLEAQGKFDKLTPEAILASTNGNTKLELNVDGGSLGVSSQVASGKIKATLAANQVPIDSFVEAVNVPVEVETGKLDVAGELASIIDFNPQQIDTSSFTSRFQADILASEGLIRTNGNLLNNNWQLDLAGDNINVTKIATTYLPVENLSTGLDQLAIQGNLSGDLADLQNEAVSLPVKINNFAVQSGQQTFVAQGDLLFTNLLSRPDLAQVALEVEGDLDFDSLPIAELVSSSPTVDQLLAERVDLRGKVDFDGLFQGKNLISDSTNLENYDLTGRLSLNNLAFNQLVFDPFISGRVDIQPERILSVDLQGKDDLIEMVAEPCSLSNCLLPYLPSSLNVSLGNSEVSNLITPISVRGDRNQADFNLEIGNFPLAFLNLAPAKSFGIEGALAGEVTGAVSANLDTLATSGNINVAKPAIGHININNFETDFAYDSQQQIAAVNSASLNFGNTEYNLEGDLSLKTGAINGRLDIPQAFVQDIFRTLGWYTIEDALALFQKPNYLNPEKINTKDILTVQESISRKLNLLSNIEQQLQAIAEKQQASGVPTELDIRGEYQGEFVVAGTINNPEVDFEVGGNQWQWRSQKRIFDFQNKPESNDPTSQSANQQIISIGEVLAQGRLEGDTLNLEQAKLQVEDTLFAANGKLSPRTQDAQFKVDNLTVATISKFVTIPVNATGRLDSEGTLQGTLAQPEISGNLNITDSTFNDLPLPAMIAGDYTYAQQKLDFQTTAPSALQVAATVPYPIEPGTNDLLTAKAKIGSEMFAFLNTFTGGSLDWVDGEGNADIQATANLDLNRKIPIYNLQTAGLVNLDQANVNLINPLFTAPILASGKIALDDQLIKVETLDAIFAEKDVSVTGSLPLLSPVAGLDEPLRVDIPEGKIKIDKLYKGKVAGNIEITSTALQPNIGGEVFLKNGSATIPKPDPKVTEEEIKNNLENLEKNGSLAEGRNSASFSKVAVSEAEPTEDPLFVPTLDDFLVKLDKFSVQQSPIFKFGVDGQLVTNGIATQPETLKSQGTINVKRGDVSWLSNNFTLVRDREHKLVFNPTESILNPYIDVHMQTEISEFENIRQLDGLRNEVPDDISRAGRTETIAIVLAIDGNADALLPGLNSTETNNCNIRPDAQPPQNNPTYSKSELDNLATCINSAALDVGGARQIVDGQEVSLTSTPNRRQGEIINLLGTQLLNFAETLQNSDADELVGLGVSQFVVAPIQRSVFYRLEDVVVGTGKKIGLDYLRIYPNLEGVYELNSNSSVRSTYDYVFNELRFEYQKKF